MIKPFATTMFLAVGLVLTSAADASYFEFCRLSGFLVSTPKKDKDAVWFRLYVRAARPAVCAGAASYEPQVCATYVGKILDAGMPVSLASNLALKSDVELIQRVWVDIRGR